MADLVRRLTDTSTTESQLAQAVVTGVFTAAVSPARMPRHLVTASHVGMGILGAAGGAVVLDDQTAGRRAAAAGGLGGLLASISWVGVVFDRRLETWLRRRGVGRPRLVMGVLAAVATFAMARAESRSAQAQDEESQSPGQDPSPQE